MGCWRRRTGDGGERYNAITRLHTYGNPINDWIRYAYFLGGSVDNGYEA